MATISVCMIVKDEEKTLARCLDSLGEIPDEIIIVDTGSADGTREVARRYTDKVFDFEWVDDFAAARNFSLSKAGCEFIYVADADEVVDEENYARFMQLKSALLPEVEVVEMAYANQFSNNTTANFDVEFRPKLFRRLRAFQFADPIHEALRTDPVVYRSNVAVQHMPTSNHGGRDLAHFARLVKRGAKFSGRLEMMYARELMIVGELDDFITARPYFEAVRANPKTAPEVMRRAACVLARGAALEQNGDLLLRYAAPELVGQPPAEICCAMGDYFLAGKDAQQAADWYVAAMSGAEPELVAASAGRMPLLGLAACYEMTGDYGAAWDYKKKAEEWSPGAAER